MTTAVFFKSITYLTDIPFFLFAILCAEFQLFQPLKTFFFVSKSTVITSDPRGDGGKKGGTSINPS